MGEIKTMPKQATESKKLSYDEIKQLLMQYQEQVRMLQDQNRQLNYAGMVQQLTFLFKVLEFGQYFQPEYLEKCVKHITTIMALPENEENEVYGESEKQSSIEE